LGRLLFCYKYESKGVLTREHKVVELNPLLCVLLLLIVMLLVSADAPGAPRQWWFGGGTDLTPAYIFEEDVKHFHSVRC